LVRADTVQDRAGRNLAGPAEEARNAPGAFPVSVLLAAEWRICPIRPSVILGPIVGGIHDDGVFGDSQFVELVEHLADLFVMGDHPVAVVVLPALAAVLVSEM